MLKKCILQIWSASPIQDINTSAPIYWRCHVISAKEKFFQKFATLRLFIKTSPINFAGMGGNGNKVSLLADPPLFSLPSTFKPENKISHETNEKEEVKFKTILHFKTILQEKKI
jgi:hypothetical protein